MIQADYISIFMWPSCHRKIQCQVSQVRSTARTWVDLEIKRPKLPNFSPVMHHPQAPVHPRNPEAKVLKRGPMAAYLWPTYIYPNASSPCVSLISHSSIAIAGKYSDILFLWSPRSAGRVWTSSAQLRSSQAYHSENTYLVVITFSNDSSICQHFELIQQT